MFGIKRRGHPDVDHGDPLPVTADESASMQLIDLRNALDSLTRTALFTHTDTDLAIDIRRAAGLPMPTSYSTGGVPVIPGRGGEGGSR